MRCLLSLLLILLVSAAGASAAFADGPGTGKKGGKAELTAEEEKFFRSKIKGWDQLDERTRQRVIARTAFLRKLTPEQRKKFESRLKKRRHGGKHFRFRDAAGQMLANRGLSRGVLRQFGLPFETEMHKRDLSQHAFERAFAMTFWRHVAELYGEDLLKNPPAKLPPHLAQRLAQLTDDPRTRRGMAYMLAKFKADVFRRELAQTLLDDPEAYVDAIGRKARETWPKAFEKAASNPEYLIRKTESVEVQRGIMRLIRRTDRLGKDESVLLIRLIDRWADKNRKNAEASGDQADGVIKSLLVGELGFEQSLVDRMPPRSDPEARAAFFQEEMRRKGFRLLDAGKRGKKPRGGNGRRPRMRKPEGVPDGDWKLILQAMKQARKEGRFRSWMDEKPEGVSDEGWEAFNDHVDALFAGRRKR